MEWSLSSSIESHRAGKTCLVMLGSGRYESCALEKLQNKSLRLQGVTLCLERYTENDAQRHEQTIDVLAKVLIESTTLREVYLECRDQLPDALCQAIARNRSIRSLHVTLSHHDEGDYGSYTHYEPSSNLIDAIERNNTIESLYLQGSIDKMVDSIVRLLLNNNNTQGLRELEIQNGPDNRRIRVPIEEKTMDLLVNAVGSSRSLKKFMLRQVIGHEGKSLRHVLPIQFKDDHLATLFKSLSLESIWLCDVQLCGSSSSGDESIYSALSSNQRLRELDLWSSTSIVQDPVIEANFQSQVESALRDSNTSLVHVNFVTFGTLRTTECIRHYLELNRAVTLLGDKASKELQ